MLIRFTNAGPNQANFFIATRLFNDEILTLAMLEYAHVADKTLRFSFDEFTGKGEAFVGENSLVGHFQVWPVIPPLKTATSRKGGDVHPR